MHLKIDDGSMEPTDLPYGEKTFQRACKKLFQHRTVTHTLPRVSTTIFNSRLVNWGPQTPGQSIGTFTKNKDIDNIYQQRLKFCAIQSVYNCISDTASLTGCGNIILSTTCFTTIPVTYGVFYGCDKVIMRLIKSWLKMCGDSCFHPLILPMVFIELERKRLLDAGENKGSHLHQRVLDMEIRSKRQTKSGNKEESPASVSVRDSETIQMLLSMNELKNGLEGLLIQLSSIRDHLGKPSEIVLESGSEDGSDVGICGMNIDLRLKEIMSELQSKLRSYKGLLDTMALATQMVRTLFFENLKGNTNNIVKEATGFTRTDSWVNFTIAKASKRDSTHMRFISIMGMIFLPGTFLAVRKNTWSEYTYN